MPDVKHRQREKRAQGTDDPDQSVGSDYLTLPLMLLIIIVSLGITLLTDGIVSDIAKAIFTLVLALMCIAVAVTVHDDIRHQQRYRSAFIMAAVMLLFIVGFTFVLGSDWLVWLGAGLLALTGIGGVLWLLRR